MGLAIVFGQAVLVFAAGLASVILFVALERWSAATAYACPRPLLALFTALLAAPAASSALRLLRLRASTSFDGDVPELFALALAAAAVLAFLFGRVPVGTGATPKRARFYVPVLVLAALPFAAWLAVAGLPARTEARRNDVRSAYDEARSEGDAAEARRLLEANPWLREELEHP